MAGPLPVANGERAFPHRADPRLKCRYGCSDLLRSVSVTQPQRRGTTGPGPVSANQPQHSDAGLRTWRRAGAQRAPNRQYSRRRQCIGIFRLGAAFDFHIEHLSERIHSLAKAFESEHSTVQKYDRDEELTTELCVRANLRH